MRAKAFSSSLMMPATPKYFSKMENHTPVFVGMKGGTWNDEPAGVRLLSVSIGVS